MVLFTKVFGGFWVTVVDKKLLYIFCLQSLQIQLHYLKLSMLKQEFSVRVTAGCSEDRLMGRQMDGQMERNGNKQTN